MTETPIRILVADDSGLIRRQIERAVASSGHAAEVVAATDGGDAVRLLADRGFDIAFLDIHMPELSGVEVLAALKAADRRTFCIAMSDRLAGDDEERLRQVGAYDFLAKPFGEERIHRVIETWRTFHTAYDVLVVDDSATVRRIVAKVLGRSVFTLRVHEAADGPAALSAVQLRPFRIIFSDFNMPGMNGMDLADELSRSLRRADVVLMSTDYTPALDAAAQRVGARAFLRKPFYPDDVDSIIHHLFNLPHPRFSKQVRTLATV